MTPRHGARATAPNSLTGISTVELKLLTDLTIVPLAAVSTLQAIYGHHSPTALGQRLTSLNDRGLVGGVAFPREWGRAPRLWHASDAGVALVAAAVGMTGHALAHSRGCGGLDLLKLCRRLPEVQDLYALLAYLARSAHAVDRQRYTQRRDSAWELAAWHRPWSPAAAGLGIASGIHLPALATFRAGERTLSAAFIVDRGYVSPRSWYTQVGRFIVWRRAHAPLGGPILLIATRRGGQELVWRKYLQSLDAYYPGSPAMSDIVRVLSIDDDPPPALLSGLLATDNDRPGTDIPIPFVPPPETRARRAAPALALIDRRMAPSAKVTNPPRGAFAGRLAWHLGPLDWAVLGTLATHPWLPPQRLAPLLEMPSLRTLRERLADLARRGLLHRATDWSPAAIEDAAGELAVLPGAALHRAAGWLDLFEATADGLDIILDRFGLPADYGAAWLGVVGGGPDDPRGGRAGRAKDLAHTLGVDAIMVALHNELLTTEASAGLTLWRNAAASARGPMRPDASIVPGTATGSLIWFELERGGSEYETVRRKFAAYRAHVAKGDHHWDLTRKPTLLVVTTGNDASEARLGAAARASGESEGRGDLDIMTTRLARISAAKTVLGSIWHLVSAGPDERLYGLRL